jgi:chorismate dehydratase
MTTIEPDSIILCFPRTTAEQRVAEERETNEPGAVRVGAVAYLNARPLTWSLSDLAPQAEIVVDLPSRLADGLARGRFDVALVPSIEYFRDPGYSIVSDACVACDGPVRSIKLYGRVPVQRIRTLALDEGSRTSAAMTRILLKERFHLEPELEQLPIGGSPHDTSADAVMLIGDRGMIPVDGAFQFVWDLGEEWSRWTGLPFVFAMWIARPGVDLQGLDDCLAAARDRGVGRLAEIARHEAPRLGISEQECLGYLRDNLRFQLGSREREGLLAFRRLAEKHQLAPPGTKLVFYDHEPA